MVDKRSKNRFLNIFVVKTWSRNKYITIKAPELSSKSLSSSGACLFGTSGSQPNVINSKAPIPIISHFSGCLLQYNLQNVDTDIQGSRYHERIANFTPARFVRGVGFALLDDAVGCGLQQGNSSNHVYPQKIFHKSGKKYSTEIVWNRSKISRNVHRRQYVFSWPWRNCVWWVDNMRLNRSTIVWQSFE